MILIIKLIREGAIFAITSVLANKLRTVLTLLGITIGIFAIISVFSIVDSLEKQVRNSISALGDNVVYIQKWPWAFGAEYPWWSFIGRPVPQLHELDEVMRRSLAAEAAAFMSATRRRVEYLNTNIDNVTIIGVSADYDQVRNFDMHDGRYFTPLESTAGRNVAVIGYEIAQNLFRDADPIGRDIRLFGLNTTVIGVFAKEGIGGFGLDHDNAVVLPVNYLNQFINVNQERYDPLIMVKARAGISNEELIDDLTGVMRSVRRLPPVADNNFALNETSLLSQGFDSVFAIISMAGWIIGGFSILVGGFGIANIMFVSVRERTSIIGIQKALGAKNYFILWQFLFEAILLSLMGGTVGLLLVFTGTTLVANIFEIDFALSLSNILRGINVSVIIGLVSGFLPAWSAARLDPVEAIRSTG
ncbi:MAG: ABC transporter permease [Bacteroidales bacterium]|nr:ABC transporter permease [Bacteroidales bacterium]